MYILLGIIGKVTDEVSPSPLSAFFFRLIVRQLNAGDNRHSISSTKELK